MPGTCTGWWRSPPLSPCPWSAPEEIHELDTAYWFGPDGRPATVRDLVPAHGLVQRADLGFPVILGAEGQLMDGMHRVARSLLEGRTTVVAVRFTEQPDPDFRYVRPEDLRYDGADEARAKARPTPVPDRSRGRPADRVQDSSGRRHAAPVTTGIEGR